MRGKTRGEARQELVNEHVPRERQEVITPHKVCMHTCACERDRERRECVCVCSGVGTPGPRPGNPFQILPFCSAVCCFCCDRARHKATLPSAGN